MHTRVAVLAVMLASLTGTSASAALPPPLCASFTFGSQVVTAREWDLVDEDDHLPMTRFAAGYRLPLSEGVLELDLAFQLGSTSATLHELNEASLSLRGLEVGAMWRWPLLRYFQPHARLGLGWDWATLSIGALVQRDSSPGATGLIGFSVPFVVNRRGDQLHEWLAFEASLGYAARPSFVFDALAAEASDEPDAIRRGLANVGELPLSGIVYRFGLTLRL